MTYIKQSITVYQLRQNQRMAIERIDSELLVILNIVRVIQQ